VAVTIVATVGSASANSYVSQADATTALEGRLNSSAWTDATSDVKNRALVEAQAELQVLEWKGSRTDATQALAWPRQYVEDPDAPADADLDEAPFPTFDDDEIPTRVKQAQIELAFQFVKAGTSDLAMPASSDGIKRKRVDVLETEYLDHRPTRGLSRYPRVMALIEPLLASGAGGITVTRG
jgi:hypothetical protein